MTNVLKIAKPGFDPLTADPKDLIFDSTLNHLKNKIAGSFTQTIAAFSSYTETVAHGLGAVHPLCMAYFRDTSNNNWLISLAVKISSPPGRKSSLLNCEIYTDTTNVYVKAINNNASSKTIEVQYEIFYENV